MTKKRFILILIIFLLACMFFFYRFLHTEIEKQYILENRVLATSSQKIYKGFDWKVLSEIKARILLPDEWYFKHENKNNGNQYYLSKENIKKDTDIFETGLTMYVYTEKQIPQKDAILYAKFQVDNMKNDKNKIIDIYKEERLGPIVIYSLKYTKKDISSSFRWTAMNQFIANSKTNTLYVLIFESPETKWDAEWNLTGKKMLDTFEINVEN